MISLRAAKKDDLSSIPGTHTLENRLSNCPLTFNTLALTHTHAYKPKRLALSPTRSEHSKPSCLSYGDDSAEPPGGLPRCALAQPLRSTHRRRRLESSSRLKEKKKGGPIVCAPAFGNVGLPRGYARGDWCQRPAISGTFRRARAREGPAGQAHSKFQQNRKDPQPHSKVQELEATAD